MTLSDIQAALAAAGLYHGKIDGIDGPQTQAAVSSALEKHPAARAWPPKRRAIAAAQAALARLGHEPGAIDGYAGHNTTEAFHALVYKTRHGRAEVVQRRAKEYGAGRAHDLPRQSECDTFYGHPGDEIAARLVTVPVPLAMRLDYDLDQTVSRVTLHRLAAPHYVAALEEVRDHYGLARLRDLGIDRYAGGHNHRRMRGGSRWSMHAYGIAVDHYAAPNGLRTPCPQALFCGPEYRAFLDIMEAHGWLPAVRLWGRDAMHFQRARMG